MAIRTATQPKRITEKFSTRDTAEINRIVQDIHGTYTEQLQDANFALHEAQRSVNRATHEQHRLEKHLKHIEDFCEQHNIALGDEGKE